MNQAPSQEEWDQWWAQPSGQAFRELLRQRREDLKEAWANGVYTVNDDFTTAIANTRAQMGCEVLDQILELDYTQFLGEIEDGKFAEQPIGPEA